MMKKILITLLIAGVAGISFAEVTVGGAIDMVIVPFQYILNEEEKKNATDPDPEEQIFGAGAGRFASNQGPRARLDLRASHEDVIGMRARIQARTDGIAIEDYLQAWWRPTDWLKIDAGRFFDDRLRGKVNDLDERMSAYTVRTYDGDEIFTRFRTHRNGGQAGLMATTFFETNAFKDGGEELSFAALLYDLSPLSSAGTAGAIFDAHPDYVTNNADAYHNIQATAAWTVKDMFQFRAQYFGAKPQVTITTITDETSLIPATYKFDVFTITTPKVEAAFAFMGVPDMVIDVGVKIPLAFKDWTRVTSNIFEQEDESQITDGAYLAYKNNNIWQAPYQASLGLKLNIGDFGLGGRVDAKFGGYTESTTTERHFGPEVNFHIWPSYNLGFARIIVNFGFEYIGATQDQDGNIVQDGQPRPLNGGNRIGAGISLQKEFGSSIIKGGVAWKNSATVNGVQEKMVISVPLFIEWYF